MKVLITGAGGFLGTNLARALVREYEVCSFSRQSYSHLQEMGITQFLGNLRKKEDLKKALKGVDIVFHVAARAAMWGRWEDFYNDNYIGTKNICDLSREMGVKKFIYTSTPSICYRKGGHCKESDPLPNDYLAFYPKSKRLAEDYVLSTKNMAVVALRPHLIWGPGEPHFLPQLIKRVKSNQLRIIGEGDNQVSVTFVDNAVYGHILAMKNLELNNQLHGKAYFLGQGPVELWPFLHELLKTQGISQFPSKKIPLWMAYKLGYLTEKYLGLTNNYDVMPRMTRFMALQLGTTHVYSHEKASKDFGYRPLVSVKEGYYRLKHKLQ